MNARGEEASLHDARALAFKVQLGEIDANTLMFSETVGAWVPAAGHPDFQVHMGPAVEGHMPEETLPAAPQVPTPPQAPKSPALVDSARATPSPRVAPPRMESPPRVAPSPRAETKPGAFDHPSPASVPGLSRPPVPEHPPIPPRSTARRMGPSWIAVLAVFLIAAGGTATIAMNPSWGIGAWFASLFAPQGSDGSGGELLAAPAPPSPRAEAAAERVAQAVVTDLAGAFTHVLDEMEVPDEPPKAWLGGRYLSAASQYPELLDYWDAFRAAVQLLRAREAHAIVESLDHHLAGLESDEGPRSVVEKLALVELAEGAGRRASVYAVVEELAAAATELHAFLLRWEDRIRYDPASGTGASQAPVIEAVAEGEVLRVEFAAALDRVLEALEDTNGLEPMRTRSFFARLSEAFEETLKPVDPDTAVRAVTLAPAHAVRGVEGASGVPQ